MSAKRFEGFLARLYVDSDARARFRANPVAEAKNVGLSSAECKALENVNWVDLEMAGRGFAKKRELKRPRSRFSWLTERLLNFISVLSGSDAYVPRFRSPRYRPNFKARRSH